MASAYTIYALLDPRNGQVRYIGQTDSPQRRFYQHVKVRTSGQLVREWVAELQELGLTPRIEAIGSADDEENALAEERRWIAHHRKEGANLLNGAHGRSSWDEEEFDRRRAQPNHRLRYAPRKP